MSSSRYSQINDNAASSPPATPSRRSSFASLRRPSFSRRPTQTQIPDPDEMDAAFDDDDDEEDGQHENRGLLGATRDRHEREWKDGADEVQGVFKDPLRGDARQQQDESAGREGMPGSYDFDRDYVSNCVFGTGADATQFLPPSSSPPPFQTHSRQHPAPGNTNGIIPSTTAIPSFRNSSSRGFLGGILPSAFQRNKPVAAPGAVGGGATSGVFANLAARPEGNIRVPDGVEGPEWVPEETQKEGPPVSL